MAADINRVVLVGRLTRDCEIKQLSNTSVCNFSIALNRRSNQAGNWVDEPNYFDIELFGSLGTALNQYLLKGKQVAVEGSLRQHRWEGQDGQKRSRITVLASNVQLLGGGQAGGGNSSQGYTQQANVGYNNTNNNASIAQPDNQQGGQAGQSMSSNGNDNDFQDDIPF